MSIDCSFQNESRTTRLCSGSKLALPQIVSSSHHSHQNQFLAPRASARSRREIVLVTASAHKLNHCSVQGLSVLCILISSLYTWIRNHDGNFHYLLFGNAFSSSTQC